MAHRGVWMEITRIHFHANALKQFFPSRTTKQSHHCNPNDCCTSQHHKPNVIIYNELLQSHEHVCEDIHQMQQRDNGYSAFHRHRTFLWHAFNIPRVVSARRITKLHTLSIPQEFLTRDSHSWISKYLYFWTKDHRQMSYFHVTHHMRHDNII